MRYSISGMVTVRFIRCPPVGGQARRPNHPQRMNHLASSITGTTVTAAQSYDQPFPPAQAEGAEGNVQEGRVDDDSQHDQLLQDSRVQPAVGERPAEHQLLLGAEVVGLEELDQDQRHEGHGHGRLDRPARGPAHWNNARLTMVDHMLPATISASAGSPPVVR